MTRTEQFITLVAKLRDAQRLVADHPTRANIEDVEDLENKVDEWLLEYSAEKVQIELWGRAVRTDEEPGAYNVPHANQEEQEDEP